MKITPSLVLDLKKYLLQLGSIILVMAVLSITITQVHAQARFRPTIQQQIPTGNRSGVIGSVVIDNIHMNAWVEISCQIGSIYGVGSTTLVQRNFGPGWRQYWCPFTGTFPGPSYYWVILSAGISEPGGQSYTLVDTSPPVWIG